MITNKMPNKKTSKISKSYKHLIAQLNNTNILALLLLDSILLPLALATSVLLRLGGDWDHRLDPFIWIFIALPIWTIPIFISLGLYKAVIKYFDEKIVVIVLLGVSLSILILTFVTKIASIHAFPKTAIIIFWVVALAYIGGTRLVLRGLSRKLNTQIKNKINVAIYGAGSAGVQLCLSLQTGHEYNPVVLFDDDETTWGSTIRGITIYRPRELAKTLRKYNVDQVLLAIPSASHIRRKQIIDLLEPLSVKIKTIPGIAEIVSGQVTINDIKEVDIEDLLGRDPIPADINLLQKNIYQKNVMVTGAGGSIGSEIARQTALLQPNCLILFDVSEFALYLIDKQLKTQYPNLQIIDVLGSITDASLVSRVLEQYKVNTIYHAAAYKHVPIVEFNPSAGVYNNAIGTKIVATAALEHNVDIMVLISTDKAVRPTNIMGADGGPITVTHPDIIRYFMTISEAVQLVIQASTIATGGEVFVLDMGDPIKIATLATRMIHLSGLSVKDNTNPDGDIEIKYTGLRPGEKLYEELLVGNNPKKTMHPRIMQGNEEFLPYEETTMHIEMLIKTINVYDTSTIIKILNILVPDYTPSNTISYIN